MKMNSLEKFLVNNPTRTWMLRRMADRLITNGNRSLRGKCVLEIGCGQGAGTELLVRRYGADKVFSFDYDPAQLALARRRHAARGLREASLFVGDGERLPFAGGQFDVIIEFAILHHMPDWRSALHEISRVLKPGGVVIFEEYLQAFLSHPIAMMLMDHPKTGWFTPEMFYGELEIAGLQPQSGQRRLWKYWLAGTAERKYAVVQ